MSSTQLSYLLNNKCLVKNFNKNISVISSYSVCFSYTLLSTHFQKVNLFLYCIDKMNNFHNNHNTVITDCFAKHTPEHLLFFSILVLNGYTSCPFVKEYRRFMSVVYIKNMKKPHLHYRFC